MADPQHVYCMHAAARGSWHASIVGPVPHGHARTATWGACGSSSAARVARHHGAVAVCSGPVAALARHGQGR
eukprot:8341594-Alexandrium_andersonii.AAC.1